LDAPKDLIIPILQGKVTTIFKLHTGRQELGGERNLSVSRRSYAVVDILSNSKQKISTLSDEELACGGFKTREDFRLWWLSKGYHEDSYINVIHFEILRLKPYGKRFLKSMGKRLPRRKDM
jgi:hypothetical protein